MNEKVATVTPEPISIAPDIQVRDAVELMRLWGVRHLPVTEEDGTVIGLITERNILEHTATHSGSNPLVREVMDAKPFAVGLNELLADVAESMAHHKFDCALVTDENKICGIFTCTDALKVLARLLREPADRKPGTMRMDDYLRGRNVVAHEPKV